MTRLLEDFKCTQQIAIVIIVIDIGSHSFFKGIASLIQFIKWFVMNYQVGLKFEDSIYESVGSNWVK